MEKTTEELKKEIENLLLRIEVKAQIDDMIEQTVNGIFFDYAKGKLKEIPEPVKKVIYHLKLVKENDEYPEDMDLVIEAIIQLNIFVIKHAIK